MPLDENVKNRAPSNKANWLPRASARLSTLHPDQMMGRNFIENPIRPLLIQPRKRVRAFYAVIIGARRSYVKGGALASNGFNHLSRVSLLLEEGRGNLLCLAGLANFSSVNGKPDMVVALWQFGCGD